MKKKTVFQICLCYLGALAIILLFQIVDLSDVYALPTPVILILRLVLNMLPAIPSIILLCACKESIWDIGFAKSNILRQLLVGVGIGAGMGMILTWIPCFLGFKDMVYQGTVYKDPWYAAYELLYFVVSVGLVEEFIFRGYILSKLERVMDSDLAPMVISSLLFGLLHIFQGNILQIFTTAVIGAFFCWCKEHIPNCTVLSLAIAHGLHDWLIRAITSLYA